MEINEHELLLILDRNGLSDNLEIVITIQFQVLRSRVIN